jgi:maltose alpha-D-glucosyltransferase/alpha-amylase
MGDNIYLGDRNGVRTPMQWTPDRNGGFSRADPAALYLPPIMDPVYGYSAVNVEAQSRSLSSLLSWTKRLIGVRKSTKVFGRGTLTFIRPANRSVLAYVRQLGDEAILCVANISRSAQAVELDMTPWKGRIPREMLGRTRFPRIGELPYLVTLPPYGFFWFSLDQQAESEPEKALPREITTLVIGDGWDSPLSGWTRRTFEHDVLPAFLPHHRWFADKTSRSITAKVVAAVPIEHGIDRFAAVIADASGPHGTSRYFLPLTVRWTRYTAIDKGPDSMLSAVRRGSREGTLLDATAEPEFIAAVLTKIHRKESVAKEGYAIEFQPTAAFAGSPLPEVKSVASMDREQSNSSVVAESKDGTKYVVKVLRRISAGIHPDLELGRFLADIAHFPNAPVLLGTVEMTNGDERTALAVVHAFVENQGDAWTVIGAALDRFVDEQRVLTEETAAENPETASMLQRVRQIGRRTAELHIALAGHPEIDAFAPEPISPADSARWTDALLGHTRGVFALLQRSQESLPEPVQRSVERLFAHSQAITAHIEAGRNATYRGMKIRHHGDFHLGQVLIAKDDAYILDFEGEPHRPLAQRRAKEPPARDVAGFLRSIDYATSAAFNREPNLTPEERAALAQRVRAWGDKLAAGYWDSYRETPGQAALWPADDTETHHLLDLFLLEKAIYEIEYELTNRPAWVQIPIEATLRILQQRGVLAP